MEVNKVISYRKCLGLTQEQIAKEIGISTDGYAKKERGEQQFKKKEMATFQKLLSNAGLQVTIDEIFF